MTLGCSEREEVLLFCLASSYRLLRLLIHSRVNAFPFFGHLVEGNVARLGPRKDMQNRMGNPLVHLSGRSGWAPGGPSAPRYEGGDGDPPEPVEGVVGLVRPEVSHHPFLGGRIGFSRMKPVSKASTSLVDC